VVASREREGWDLVDRSRSVDSDATRWTSYDGRSLVQLPKGGCGPDGAPGPAWCPENRRFLKALREFDTYIRKNARFIPNYGERHRAGEAISSATAESAVNQVISKRMVKSQQMRWSPRGAHLLLQIRTRALNDDLADAFCRWYPGFTHASEATLDDQQVAA
jgi:hypothetical protein